MNTLMTALIICVSVVLQSMITAGIMTVFSLTFVPALWIAALPTLLILFTIINVVTKKGKFPTD